ncbi:ROK family protein [Actinoplanes xinjiangensis]
MDADPLGQATRSDLVKQTRLPRAAVAALLDGLARDGVVERCAADAPRAGRPSPCSRLVAPGELLVGVAIGGDGVRVTMFAGFSPAGEISAVLGRPVRVANNAQLAALAESRRGAARGARDVLFLSCDQYTGAGLVSGGRPHAGGDRICGGGRAPHRPRDRAAVPVRPTGKPQRVPVAGVFRRGLRRWPARREPAAGPGRLRGPAGPAVAAALTVVPAALGRDAEALGAIGSMV